MAASSTIAVATPVPVQQNIVWHLGSTWLLMLEMIGAKGQLLPSDILDVQLRIASATAVLLDLNLGDGIICPDPDGAYALAQIDPARQAGFMTGAYSYEARCLTLTGGVFEIQYGGLTIGPSLYEQFLPPADAGADEGGVIGLPGLQVSNL